MRVVPPDFLYDLNSPFAYLAAMRVDDVLGPGVRWSPISQAFVLRANDDREPWSFHEPTRSAGKADCEQRAARRGLPPMTWPPGWPIESYSLTPLRAALVAEEHGLQREYARAAFARNFVSGTGLLGDAPFYVAAEVGLDPELVRAGVAGPARQRLVEATDAAIAAGAYGVPSVLVGDEMFWGDDRLEDAAAAARRKDRAG